MSAPVTRSAGAAAPTPAIRAPGRTGIIDAPKRREIRRPSLVVGLGPTAPSDAASASGVKGVGNRVDST